MSIGLLFGLAIVLSPILIGVIVCYIGIRIIRKIRKK
jgi:hypothetical protein